MTLRKKRKYVKTGIAYVQTDYRLCLVQEAQDAGNVNCSRLWHTACVITIICVFSV